jgi:DNA-binding IclR family transcriptional regulator
MLTCGHCDGTGKKEAAKLTETLSLFMGPAWFTTQDLAAAADISGENMANRLAELLRLGLVERRGNRPHEWRLPPKEKA